MRLHSFLHARDGGISMMTAVSSVALIGFLGLAVDMGAVYLDARRLQGSVDLAAIAALQSPGEGRTLAHQTLVANQWPQDIDVNAVRGVYTADRNIAPHQRFVPNRPGANAVRVRATASTPLYFARLFVPSGRMNITRTATATQSQHASFQIGSRLLALQGGLANDVLGGLTGSEVNLSVMDYQSLLRADVELLSYVEALRTRLDLEAASYDETLSGTVDAGEALEAIADTIGDRDRRAASSVRSMANAASGKRVTDLNELIDLGPYGGQQEHTARTADTEIRVSAMDLAQAILQIANGDRQVALDLGAGVPGLASTRAWLAIGERPNNSPWLTVTDDLDVIVRTAQARLYVEAQVTPGGLNAVSVRVPALVELAAAQARLDSVNCGVSGRRPEVALQVAPSMGALSLGEVDLNRLDNFRSELRPAPAQLARVGLLRVEGQAYARVGGESWQRVRFSSSEIERRAYRTVSTRDTAQAAIGTLLSNTELRVAAGGLGLSTGPLLTGVRGGLTAAAAPLDRVVNELTALLGIGLGQADVRINGVRCGGAVLVG